jgi:LPXTG-site transpeptidase (sortase) family protein
MYTRKRSPFANLFSLILLGMLAGIIFVIYDNATSPINQPMNPVATLTTVAPTSPGTIQTPLPSPAEPSVGLMVEATLYIPQAGISAPIIQVFLDGESWDVSQLGDNVGHLQGTAWLDQPGNIVLSGHVERRNGRPGIFAGLRNLEAGAEIIVMYEGIERRYSVSERKTVEPNDLTPLYPVDKDLLTLITCDAYDFFQNTYQKRVVVVAERVS